MKNGWRTAFFICLALLICVIVASGYLLLITGLSSGHTSEMLANLEDDVELTSIVYNEGLKDFDAVRKRLDQIPELGYSASDDRLEIHLTYVTLLFNKSGVLKGFTYDRPPSESVLTRFNR